MMKINTVRLVNGQVERQHVDLSNLMDIEFVLEDGRRVYAMGGTDLIVTSPDGILIIVPEDANQITIKVVNKEQLKRLEVEVG